MKSSVVCLLQLDILTRILQKIHSRCCLQSLQSFLFLNEYVLVDFHSEKIMFQIHKEEEVDSMPIHVD